MDEHNDHYFSWEDLNEAISGELRAIGFHGGYQRALSFLEWYRNLLQEKLNEFLDEAVPVPDLWMSKWRTTRL